MIKPTYYNLPLEKREKILSVTKNEFKKSHKRKLTITNVIEQAGISRGSFYQYFDDKVDLVALVVDDMLNQITNYIKNELLDNGGNIFIIPLKIFEIITEKNSEFNGMIKISNQNNQNSSLINDYMQYRFHNTNFFESLIKYVNTENFSKKDDEYVCCVIYMLLDLIKASVFNINQGISTPEKEKEMITTKIEIIRNGVIFK